MAIQPSPRNDEQSPIINIGRVESLNLYQITENELETLEKGSSASLDFNFAIFLFSSAFAFVIARATCDFKSDKIEIILTVYSIGAALAGLYLTFRWWHARNSIKEVVSRIKNRINNLVRDPEEPRLQPKDLEPNYVTAMLQKSADIVAELQYTTKNKSEK